MIILIFYLQFTLWKVFFHIYIVHYINNLFKTLILFGMQQTRGGDIFLSYISLSFFFQVLNYVCMIYLFSSPPSHAYLLYPLSITYQRDYTLLCQVNRGMGQWRRVKIISKTNMHGGKMLKAFLKPNQWVSTKTGYIYI